MKRTLLVLIVVISAFLGAGLGIVFTLKFIEPGPTYSSIETHQKLQPINYTVKTLLSSGLNFEVAAKLTTPAIVHIRTVYGSGSFSVNPLEHYFKPHSQSSGSGVIISDDGYIVTNNHVIEDATSIEVVMNSNQRFYAKLIGKDPSTDLALLKIKGHELPFVKYGDSDNITPGEWVLAIGNPFDLNSTVTAGIISAKARNIGILRDRNNLQVESFIQTDAAVNPGNSGGALVNLKGELIGINSAIATSTGSYSGYSFAIPVSLVKKIMDDLLEFGQVQRGLLGVQIRDITAELAEDQNLDVVQGVFVSRVNNGSAAAESGIIEGDVITAINEHPIGTVSELQEWVARNRPGQSVNVTFRRNGKNNRVTATLKNFEGSEKMEGRKIEYKMEGATFEELSYKELTKMSLEGGVVAKSILEGKWKKSGMKEEFIITHIDKVPVDNVADLNRIIEYKQGGVLIEGIYRTGEKGTFALDW